MLYMNNVNFNPEDLFLKTKSKEYSYEDLTHFTTHFQKILQTCDIQVNQPIGLYGPSTDEMIFIVASCWLLDIPFVVFNHHLPTPKIEQQIGRIQPGLVIINDSAEIKDRLTLSFDSFKLIKILNGSQKLDDSSVKEILNTDSSNENNIFGYFFTSGTSSAPKIVPLKRHQILSAAKSSAGNILPSANECWLLCMPLFHVGGISIILRSLLYGSAIFFMPNFVEEDVRHLLSGDSDVVAASLVPTMHKRLLENREFSVHENFQAILLGGGPVSNQLIEASIERNIPIITSYGMTETCAQIAANPLSKIPDDKKRMQSAGSVFEPNRIEIRNENNKPVPAGESGNVWIKGPQVFDGYLDKTSNNIDEHGWFNTGDFGRLDANDRLYIESRRTDLIITGGENVSPEEVEQVLMQYENIREAVVFGIPDEEWGEQVTAAIIPDSSEGISSESLKKHLKKHLAPYKCPKQFLFVDEIPRTHNGKIQRTKLKELIR